MSESVIGIGKAKVEVRTGKYRTAFAPRDNQSAANQIALLQSMLVDRDARLAAAEAAFRTLRAAWFAKCLRNNGHEREWEDEEHERRRQEGNSRLLEMYSKQTEWILRGESWPVFPMCEADMDEAAKGGRDEQS